MTGLLAPAAPARAAAGDVAGDTVLGDFESGVTPWFTATSGATTVSLAVTPDAPATGSGAARLQVNAPSGTAELVRGVPSTDARSLSFAIRSTQLKGVVVRMVDGTGQAHQQTRPLTPGTRWQTVTVNDFAPAGQAEYVHWGGANDGVWHGPLKRLSLLVDAFRLVDGPAATIDVDDVTVQGPPPDLAVVPTATGNAFSTGEEVSFGIRTAATSVEWAVRDARNAVVASGARDAAELGGSLALGELPTGWYAVDLVAVQPDGRRVTGGTDVSVLPASGAREDRIGVATHYGQAWSTDTIPLIADAGVGFARDEAYWAEAEKVKGTIDFPARVDAYTAALSANHLEFFDILAYGNGLYHQGEAPATDAGRAGFANYADVSAATFGTDDTFYEVWNEWNLRDRNGPAGATAENYAALLARTAERVRAAHPGVKLAGPALAPMDDWPGWVDRFIAAGGLDDLDAFTTHPYDFDSEPEEFTNHVAVIRAKLDAAGHRDLPIWLSEQGWHTSDTPLGADEKAQARDLSRAQLLALGKGIGRYTVYDFKDDGTDPKNPEHRFGMIRNDNDPRGAYTPKPAFVAQGILTRQTSGRAVRQVLDLGGGRYGVEFGARSGEPATTRMQALWALKPETWSIKATGDAVVTDLYGTRTTLRPDADGRVHVAVGKDPIYLTGELGEVQARSPYALTVDKAVEAVAPAATWTVTAADRALEVSLRTGTGTTSAQVLAGETRSVAVTLPAAGVGAHTWTAEVRAGDRTIGLLTATADVVARLGLTGAHALDAAGAGLLRLTLVNRGTEPVKLDGIDWTVGSSHGRALPGTSVPGDGSVSVDIPVPEPGAWSATATGDATATAQGTLVDADPVDVPYRPVQVDGKIDAAVSALPAQTLGAAEQVITGWAGDADHSGRLWLTHDTGRLYLSAVITDNAHAQPARGADMWQGDSVQLGVTPGWPGEGGRPVSEIGTALTGAGPVDLARWLPANATTEGLTSAVTRDEAAKTTTYELSVPFGAIGVTPADRVLSATVAVNENDGTGRRGWSTWGKGVAESKDPAKFRPLRLLAATPGKVGVTATALSSCLFSPGLTVMAVNREREAIDLRLVTPLGERTYTGVAPGRAVLHTFPGSGRKLAGGTAVVSAGYLDGGGNFVLQDRELHYRAATCRR
ncbi:sugar-binding protein [Sphaerisporangium sp. NPDC005289]|uniref:sugar-binding protein n=1 Tax=Sphaerisporangium sp. NPDC005289 TaxID=3155247 RepID=UPI0033B2637F